MEEVYFIFKGVNSEEYLGIKKLPSIFKAERDIEMIEVEGRDGFLTQDKGTYRGVIKTVECQITDLTEIDFICSWLNGSGEVTFSNEPNKKYKGIIKNQIEFSKVVTTYHTFIIQFECQPHKYSVNDDVITLTKSETIFNSGTAISKPTITIYGTGSVSLIINDEVTTITNISGYCTLNSDLMDCYKEARLMNQYMYGDFPVLKVGNNTVSWVGSAITRVEIKPNWRWL